MRDLSHVFSFLSKKNTRGEKGYEFLSYVFIMWLLYAKWDRNMLTNMNIFFRVGLTYQNN